jgi:hypothetical protein
MEVNNDISDAEAMEDVYQDMKSTYRTAMLNTFGSKLLWFDAMKKDPVYKSIKATIQQVIDSKGYDPEEALEYSILKRNFLFDKVLERYDIPDLEGEDASTQSKAAQNDAAT